jgi:leader peptidase (prepilin peptidase)/N-methyltransferase
LSSPSDPEDRLAGGSSNDTRDRIVGVVGLLAAGAVAWTHRDQPLSAAALTVVVAVSAWLTIIDLREHRLPNRIVGPLAAAVTLGLGVAGLVDDDLGRAGQAILIGVLASLLFLVGNLFGGLGMGDVKYAFPAAAVLGWFGRDALMTAALVTALSGALVALAVLARGRGRDHALPYGPFMAAGLVSGLLVSG